MIADLAKLADLLGGPPHQDWIYLGGQRSPGLAVVKGAGSPRNWDIRAGYGMTGAFVVFTGQGLAKFDVDIFAWEKEHFDDWKKFARRVLMAPSVGLRPRSLPISHPTLNAPPLSILQVVVEDVTQWEQGSDDGLWACTIKLIEYREPIPILLTPRKGPDPVAPNLEPPKSPEELLAADKLKVIEDLAK